MKPELASYVVCVNIQVSNSVRFFGNNKDSNSFALSLFCPSKKRPSSSLITVVIQEYYTFRYSPPCYYFPFLLLFCYVFIVSVFSVWCQVPFNCWLPTVAVFFCIQTSTDQTGGNGRTQGKSHLYLHFYSDVIY